MEKYDNLGMVGEGSYGMVMKCKHKESGQIVAIKKFLESEDDKMVKKIAMREVRMLRKLRHENLVNLIEVFRRRKRLYLVFEFVDHTVLDDLEKYPNGLNEMSVRKILWQVLRGVEFCHSHNIIHRDIKPENILNSRGGVIKLCDFGFARTLAAPGEAYTDYVATRWYRAPELLVGDTKYGRGVDIWAVGCVGGEVLRGDALFPGKSDIDQLDRILKCVGKCHTVPKAVDIWAVGCLITEMLTGDPLFPGDSDIDQLYHIIKCFGNLCPRHREIFQRNPLFAGMRLPDVRDVEPLEKKFPKFSGEVLDLMKQCLRLDPNDRPSSSFLLRHEFFKKDGFEDKVIPELRARIMKDSANNMLARKEASEKKEQERKKKKSKEMMLNNTQEVKDATNISANKKPSDKNLPRESPEKQNTASPKKENILKSNLKTPPIEEKKHQKEAEKDGKRSMNTPKQSPAIEKASGRNLLTDSGTPRFKLADNPPTDDTKSNIPPFKRKKGVGEENIPTSQNTSTKSTPNGILKSNSNKISSTRAEPVELYDKLPLRDSAQRVLKAQEEKHPSKVSVSDTQLAKEKQLHTGAKTRSIENTHKEMSSMEQKQLRKDGSRVTSHKDSENSSRQTAIPSLQAMQTQSKNSTPDPLLIVNSSTSSSPHTMTDKQIPTASYAGPPAFKGMDKVKKSSQINMRKNEASGQATYDRSMYPDKTSNFEKMMMTMSNTTSITHPAIKKSNNSSTLNPGQVGGFSIFSNAAAGGMPYQYRHLREDKSNNLPLWSNPSLEEKNTAFHSSSLDSNSKINEKKRSKQHEDKKTREKSPKHSKKEGKTNALGHEDKPLREPKGEPKHTRLPDLGHKITVGVLERDHFPDLKLSGQEGISLKSKKAKTKSILTSMPALDAARGFQRSRTPSPTGNYYSDPNFPSVHSKY